MVADHGAEQADPAGDGRGRRAEKPARTLAAQKIAPSVASGAETHRKPLNHGALNHKAAGESVEGEQGRQAEYHAASMQAEQAGTAAAARLEPARSPPPQATAV